nr:thiopurine S-methyltransferase [uncultured Pseudomonas sp.]
MEPAFWQQRWADNQIGFHQSQVNPYLKAHWPRLKLPANSKVLVPLCGKSLDMAWLAGQGHRVMGVELSRLAVEGYFTEQGLEAQVSQRGAFEVWRHGDVELWCGDFFALSPHEINECTALYDRAALIALPLAMREQYVRALSGLMPTPCRGLVVTLDYDQALVAGPPFSVGDEALRQGFAGWQIDELEAVQVIEQSPKFVQAGASSLWERVYRVSR